jgi:hypothetical protein
MAFRRQLSCAPRRSIPHALSNALPPRPQDSLTSAAFRGRLVEYLHGLTGGRRADVADVARRAGRPRHTQNRAWLPLHAGSKPVALERDNGKLSVGWPLPAAKAARQRRSAAGASGAAAVGAQGGAASGAGPEAPREATSL